MGARGRLARLEATPTKHPERKRKGDQGRKKLNRWRRQSLTLCLGRHSRPPLTTSPERANAERPGPRARGAEMERLVRPLRGASGFPVRNPKQIGCNFLTSNPDRPKLHYRLVLRASIVRGTPHSGKHPSSQLIRSSRKSIKPAISDFRPTNQSCYAVSNATNVLM